MYTAKTLAAVANQTNPLAASILNREFSLTREFVRFVIRQTQFSWHGRKPKPSLVGGTTRKTDLDLLSVLMELYYRQAHIELTAYENKLPWQIVVGEQHVGGTRRYGPIIGFNAHGEHLSISVTINDLSVFNSDTGTFGAPRSYMIADYDGSWHKGWHGLSWEMTDQERAYFTRRQLLTSDGIDFEDYIHQNRRQSVYGAPYLLLKLLLARIEDEIRFYEQELKHLKDLGVECPAELLDKPRSMIAGGATQSTEVPVFTMEVAGPVFRGEYATVTSDTVGYRLAHRLIRFLTYELRPIVQFVVRADEVAFYRFAREKGFVAHWACDAVWRSNTSGSRARIELAPNLTLSYFLGKTEKKVAV